MFVLLVVSPQQRLVLNADLQQNLGLLIEKHSCVESRSVKQYASFSSETFIMKCNTLQCLSVQSLFGQEKPSPENSRLLRACRRV